MSTIRMMQLATHARSAGAMARRRPWNTHRSIAPMPRCMSSLDAAAEHRQFRQLAATFAAIEQSRSSRDTCVTLLADCLRGLLPSPCAASSTINPGNDLAAALFLTSSQLAPPHEGVELRFGTKTVVPVLQRLLGDGCTSVAWDELLPTLPDYSAAVPLLMDQGVLRIPFECSGNEQPLSVAHVHAALVAMATEQGNGSVQRKQDCAVELLKKSRTVHELVFLVRFLAHQKLRISMGEKTILTALAQACVPKDQLAASTTATDGKAWTEAVVTAYSQLPDYGALAAILCELLADTAASLAERTQRLLEAASPRVGVPVLTMAAYPIASVHEALNRVRKSGESQATCEFKYDGARVQLHWSPTTRRVFSRNMEDTTAKYGSLLDALEPQLRGDVTEIVLEGEVVAIDRESGAFLPFQVLQTKTTTAFCLFAFDLLSVNGENLIPRTLLERRELLKQVVAPQPGYVHFVEHMDVEVTPVPPLDHHQQERAQDHVFTQRDVETRVREYLATAVAVGCEGLMVKTLTTQAEYRAGARSFAWMKLKHDYLTDESTSMSQPTTTTATTNGVFLPDTLDLVPIAAFYGKGRRAGVFGSFLMASYDALSGNYETIGKVGSGFSDLQLSHWSETLRAHVLKQATPPTGYIAATTAAQRPDVWLTPAVVWEIKATQLTLSPSYTAGHSYLAESTTATRRRRGLALRFPRFVRERPEKSPDQATDSQQIAQLFQDQAADTSNSNNSTGTCMN